MEGEASELEIDSELVMSFYDQYQVPIMQHLDSSLVTTDSKDSADDIACKVYGVNTGIPSLDDPDSGGTDHSSVIELKAVLPSSPGRPTVSSSVQETNSGSSWNLPDLLVGLEGGQGSSMNRPCHSPPPSQQSAVCLPQLICSTSYSTSYTIPSSCTTSNSLQQVTISQDHRAGQQPPPLSLDSFKHHQSDSLLEALLGLGILNPPPVTAVKSEFVNGQTSVSVSGSGSGSSSGHQYNLCDPSTGVSSLVTDLTTLQVPNFELNFSPKSEPGVVPSSTVSIANIDILTKSEPQSQAPLPLPLPLDLIAQHCTLLPPDMVNNHNCHDGQTVLIPSLDSPRTTSLCSFISTDQIADQTMAELSPIMQDSIKEEEDVILYSYSIASAGPSSEEDSMEHMDLEQRGIDIDTSNPSYKSFTRCHLCVRIFSTKANLSSHIRHVHMGEAKHSRVKSIPCPHCQKMFSRKGHMTEHVRTVHEGKKRIYKEVNCQHCGKTFRRKWGLNIHISSAHADLVSSLVK